MIRFAISPAAFKAIKTTLPVGAIAYEAEITRNGAPFIWVERRALDRLVLVVRLALLDAEVSGLKELHDEVTAVRDAWQARPERVTLAPEHRLLRRLHGVLADLSFALVARLAPAWMLGERALGQSLNVTRRLVSLASPRSAMSLSTR
jgi:hypothetical protein